MIYVICWTVDVVRRQWHKTGSVLTWRMVLCCLVPVSCRPGRTAFWPELW